jgi:mannose-6-phosphate isomerase-like protein (cupin superfamily)
MSERTVPDHAPVAVPDRAPAVATAAPLAGQTLGPEGGAFVLAEWAEPAPDPAQGAPRPVAPLHVHHEDDEAWYVLEGTLSFRVGDREVTAPAGAAVFGPRGLPHTYWNPGPGPARYLLVMAPATQRLIAELHATADRSPAALQALFRRHGCELL